LGACLGFVVYHALVQLPEGEETATSESSAD
jgi:hypothetical protein